MQSQFIFIFATLAYFACMVIIVNPSISFIDSITGRFLLSLALSGGYAILTKTMNAGGLSYLALAVLYGTILVGFLILYSVFLTTDTKSLLTGTYESLISSTTDLSEETTLYSKYKNTASSTYAINLSVKISRDQGQLFARKTANGDTIVKVDVVNGGGLKIITKDNVSLSNVETTINADKVQLSSTQYVPFTFVFQPDTLIVYRNGVVIKSVHFQTPIKQPTKEDNIFIIGKILNSTGCSLDVFRFSDTNIL